jgi:predicted O-linked N-acetylglucosamine transferase (SPINDLY family)
MIQKYHSYGYNQRNVIQLTARDLNILVYCITVHNSQPMETAKMPTIDKWIKKM